MDRTTAKEKNESAEGFDVKPPSSFPKELGQDPETGLTLSVRLGPYGIYLQWGEGAKPRRVGLPKGLDIETLTFQKANVFGRFPRELGTHPADGLKISSGIGRFGPYLKHGDKFVSVKDLEIVLEGTLEEAVAYLQQKAEQPARPRRNLTPAKKAAAKKSAGKKKPTKKLQRRGKQAHEPYVALTTG